jgi:hypothetical protein
MDSDLFLTKIENIVYDNCEWCFQFDDEEPRVFAAAEKPEDPIETPKVTFTLSNNCNSNIVLPSNGFLMFSIVLFNIISYSFICTNFYIVI